MDLNQLYESEASDRADRLQAMMVHTQITQWLERNAERPNNGMLPQDGSGPLEGSYLILPHMVDLDEEYPDLFFVLSPKVPNYTGSLGFYKEGIKVIFIHCLIGPHDTRYASTRWGTMKKTFVHEFMHYLLRKRSKKRGSSTDHANKGDYDTYFNNADETNSYYQEAAHEMVGMTRAVCEMSPEHALEWSNKTTVDLMNYTKKCFFDQSFLTHLNADNTRALNKRLARFIEETIRPMLNKAVEKNS